MNFLKRCWQSRWVRGLAWTFITLVTLYALLCAWVNWSGAREWRKVQAMFKAEGETLDFRTITHEPVPEAENFCAIPLLKDIALAEDNDANKGAPAATRKRLEVLKLSSEGKRSGARPKFTGALLGNRADLKMWADWLHPEGAPSATANSEDAARDILATLSKHDAMFQELAAGLSRPKAQWTPEWKTRELPESLFSIQLPHYSALMGLDQTLTLRACAAARAGDAAKAHESALILARLGEASLNDPFLIGVLVGIANTASLCHATWELCDAHAGTGKDFTRLESALTNLQFRRAFLDAWRCELAAQVNAVQFLKGRPDEMLGLLTMSGEGAHNKSGDRLMHALPLGLFDASSAVLADCELRHIIKPMRDQGWAAAFQSSVDFENEIKAMKVNAWTRPSGIITALLAPAATRVIHRAAYTQTLINQALIACALERFRIEKENYPDSLDAVKLANGSPLPLDEMSGKPMAYRRTDDGKYVLWSVGFDGNDDGGKRVLDEKKPDGTNFHEVKYVGDWVWSFSAQ